MCQVEVAFYVETAARRKAYPLDILPASSLIGRVATVNWVTHAGYRHQEAVQKGRPHSAGVCLS